MSRKKLNNEKIVFRKKIKKLETEIKQNLDQATQQFLFWKERISQLKGGLIALEMLLQKDKETEKPKVKK